MAKQILIYGAYGYTGELIARFAKEQELNVILAGRDSVRTQQVARRYGMQYRVFSLDNPKAVAAGVYGANVVVHAAGPFSRTSQPMLDACLRTKTHYLDITGELEVFEALKARDTEAKQAGIMVLPGAGFDVVPSDCLAAHLKERLPDATHLTLAFQSRGGSISHGTATTMIENLHRGSMVRRNGELTRIPAGSLTRDVDFGNGPRHTMAIPWGDLSTAFVSTGIPNIEVYTAVKKSVSLGSRAAGLMGPLLATKSLQRFLKNRVDARPAGPSDEERRGAGVRFWGHARNAKGGTATTSMSVPEGYTLTALTSLELAKRAAAGGAVAGYQTPSMAFGSDFIKSFGGVEVQDMD